MARRSSSPRRRLALVLLAMATSAGLVAPPGAGAAPSTSLTRYPYLTDSVQSSVTVNWATTTAATTGSVQWGPAASCTANTTTAAKTSISVNGSAQYQWKATLPTAADTTYCYRVRLGTTDLLGTDATPSFTSQVAAGSSAPFSFAVFGDWGQAYAGSANADQANVLRQISLSGSRFALMTGDTAYPGGDQKNYGDLRQTGTDVSGVFGSPFWGVPGRSVPVFNVTGNHGFTNGAHQVVNWPEGNAASSSGGRYAMESYPSIDGSTPKSYPSFWYAFDAGRARFYVLTTSWADSNLGTGSVYANDAAAHWTPTSAEYKWLANDLATHPRALKFAFWHYPMYADSSGQPSDTYLQGGKGTLQGLLDDNNVGIAFNGHAHGYQRNRPDPAGLVSYVRGNGGAALGKVSGCSAFDLYALGSGCSHCGGAPGGLGNDHVFGFAKVTVNGQKVTVTPTDELGRTYDVQTYTFPSSEPDSQKPTVPANLTATAGAPGSVQLSWSASTDDTGVTGYRVYRDGALLTTLTGTGTTYTDATVAPSTTYRYEVTALDAAGNESAKQSTPATVTTPGAVDRQPPTAPGNLTGKAVSSTQVQLTWTASTDDVGVTGYDVYRDGVLLSTQPPGATTFSDESAPSGTTPTYAVSAVDAAGNESIRSTVSVPVPTATGGGGDVTPPSAPGTPLVDAVTASSVSLSWAASTDDVGVTGYRVLRDGAQVGTTAGSATSFQDTGLAASTTYGYTIQAVDAAGNASAISPATTATTSSSAMGGKLTFAPTDDATIDGSAPTAKLGTATRLTADASPVNHFLIKFTVSGTGTGTSCPTISAAKLRLTVGSTTNDNSPKGGDFRAAVDSSWSESTVTWGTAPAAAAGPPVASIGTAVALNTTYLVDITPIVTGNGTFTIRASSTSSDGARYYSRDGNPATLAPELQLTCG